MTQPTPPRCSTWIEQHAYCEWLLDDPRSAHAMLHGRGDGREKRYLAFRAAALKSFPHLDEDEIAERYRQAAGSLPQGGWRHPMKAVQQVVTIFRRATACQAGRFFR